MNLNEQARLYFIGEMDITVGEFRAELDRLSALAAIAPELVEALMRTTDRLDDEGHADIRAEILAEKAHALLAQEATDDK